MNLSDLMTEAAARHGDRTAIHQDGVTLSYTALERASALVAGCCSRAASEREVAYYMADSDARVLFAWHEFAEPATAGARGRAAEGPHGEDPAARDQAAGRDRPLMA